MITLILLIFSVEVLFFFCIIYRVGDHSNCPSSSSCHMVPYAASKDILTSKAAEEALVGHLKATYLYRNAESFCKVRIASYLM